MLTWVRDRKGVLGVSAGAVLLMLVVLGPQSMFPFRAATHPAATEEGPSKQPHVSNVRPQKPLNLPARRLSFKTLESMLSSDRAELRQTAIRNLAERPQLESVLLLLAHLDREREQALLTLTILSAKKAGKLVGQERVGEKLTELFKDADSKVVRGSVIAAFELHGSKTDVAYLTQLAKAATAGEEARHFDELLKKYQEKPSTKKVSGKGKN